MKLHGFSTSENRSYTLWVFSDDWMEEIKLRESEYLHTEFEAGIKDKTNGTRNHVWGIYFWPVDEQKQEEWFDKYLKARDLDTTKLSGEKLEEKLQKVDKKMDSDKPSSTDAPGSIEKPGGGDSKEKDRPDRNTRIERQASMHFASRMVSAIIESGRFDDVLEDYGEEEFDERVEEELNKWMRKFNRGVTTGEVQ